MELTDLLPALAIGVLVIAAIAGWIALTGCDLIRQIDKEDRER